MVHGGMTFKNEKEYAHWLKTRKVSTKKRSYWEADLEKKRQHIEQFGPILIDGACRITKADKKRRARAMEGLAKILGRDAKLAEEELKEAIVHSEAAIAQLAQLTGIVPGVVEEDEKQKTTKPEQLNLEGIEPKKKAAKKK